MLATDPPVSEAQRRAMWAAAEGHSTLGIPKSVGKEFVGKDGAPIGAGIVFVAPDGDVLLLRRGNDEENFAGHWALPGGKADGAETAEDAANREFAEECGLDIDMESVLKLMDQKETPTGMSFSTFAKAAKDKFVPKLNGEHSGYCWASLDKLPAPLHPAVQELLGSNLGVKEDMQPEEWESLRTNFAKWTREEQAEGEHADDELTKLKGNVHIERPADWKEGLPGRGAEDQQFALDAKSVRSYDVDGRLIVNNANISKANVCPYWGSEIPNCEELGLDPERQYMLLRAPDELKKAAETSNGIPLFLGHEPTTPDDHPHDRTVGTVGTDGLWNDPYLSNSLRIWTREGIDAVESEEAKELSCGYRYTADMTPGTFKGIRYDGVMRNIVFNHVALVPEGRAGADVVVGDSQIKGQGEVSMSQKVLSRFAGASAVAVAMYLQPRLAKDAKVDLTPLFADVTKKNFPQRKATLAADIKKAANTIGLAKDAKVDDVVNLLDKLESCELLEGADEDPNSGLPMNAAEMKAKDEAEAEKKRKKEGEDRAARDKRARDYAASKMSAEDMKGYDDIMGEVDGNDAEKAEAEKNARGTEGSGAAKPAKDGVSQAAMDAALKTHGETIRRQMRDTAQAYADVEPYVGKLALGMDSAEEVYRTALKGLGMDAKQVDGLHKDALKPILQAQKKPGAKASDIIAQDALHGDGGGFSSRWGDTVERVGRA